MASGKQYGLQINKKPNQGAIIKHSVFGEDSDSEKSDGASDWLKKTTKRDFSSTVSKRQAKLEIDKALKEDATVFQYDEIYDAMDQQKQSTSSKEKDRKPKYVQKLLVAADKRKAENERRYERQVQKEREAEGDEFKDKETFVTSAYKKKLEEFAKMDADQKRQDMLEEIGDVTKQQDISGFYRHLYQTTVADKEEEVVETPNEQKELAKEEDNKKGPNRQYRKRKESNSSADKDADSNLDSSSSGSSSSSDSEESGGNSSHSDTEDPKRIRLKNYSAGESAGQPINSTASPKPGNSPKAKEKHEPKKKEVESVVAVQKKDKDPPPPAVDIWKKRTIGPLFDAALKRYLERKASRAGGAA